MTAKPAKKKFLFILDPLEHLDFHWDTSLRLVRELNHRKHAVWYAQVGDIRFEKNKVYARAHRLLSPGREEYVSQTTDDFQATYFDMILIRKEPPFDMSYVYLTHLLELIADQIPVINHPRGIRNTNEKLSCLNFSQDIPDTLITNELVQVVKFQKKINSDLVLKPLDQKGGTGVALIKKNGKNNRKILHQAFRKKEFMAAQRFLKANKVPGDKRILILDGKVLSAYEKHPAPGEFRSNLSLDGTFHETTLTPEEKRIAANLKPYLKRHGLFFVGLDIMQDKLLEINVTCPAGIPESEFLYPKLKPLQAWADSLENLLRHHRLPAKLK